MEKIIESLVRPFINTEKYDEPPGKMTEDVAIEPWLRLYERATTRFRTIAIASSRDGMNQSDLPPPR